MKLRTLRIHYVGGYRKDYLNQSDADLDRFYSNASREIWEASEILGEESYRIIIPFSCMDSRRDTPATSTVAEQITGVEELPKRYCYFCDKSINYKGTVYGNIAFCPECNDKWKKAEDLIGGTPRYMGLAITKEAAQLYELDFAKLWKVMKLQYPA